MKMKEKNNRIMRVKAFVLAFAFVFVYSFGLPANAGETDKTFSDFDEAVNYVKTQMLARNQSIEFDFDIPDKKISISETAYKELDEAVDKRDFDKSSQIISDAVKANVPEESYVKDILKEAVKHTGEADEGDYLQSCLMGETRTSVQYDCSYKPEGGSYYIEIGKFSITYTLDYYTTKAQEDTFKSKANGVINSLKLSKLSDYEKFRLIYSYIAENVTYDYEHLNDESYTIKQSAYAALINGTSVCQGYSSLLYYMANKAGLDCRIVVGTALNKDGVAENHSWNLVKIEDKYYYVDVTWDSGSDKFKYFLCGSASNEITSDHTLDGFDVVTEENVYVKPSEVYDNISTSAYSSDKPRSDIGSAKVEVSNVAYDGERCTSEISVNLGGKQLIKGIDYEVLYELNPQEGSCTVKITGIGLYQSTIDYKATEVAGLAPETTEAATEAPVQDTAQAGAENGNSEADGENDGTINYEDGSGIARSSENGDIVYAVFDQPVEKGYNLKIGENSYTVDKAGKGGSLTFSGTKSKQSEVVVPAVINIDGTDYKVSSISSKAFKGNTKLTSVIIGKNVKKIGAKAFYGCKKLGTINIKSKSLKSVGEKAFANIKTKAKVTVPKGKMTKYKKLLRKRGVSNKSKFVTAK